MDDVPDPFADDLVGYGRRRLSREQFEALLIDICNGAQMTLTEWAVTASGDEHDAKIEDARDVWHAAEVALGILLLGKYVPKREALNDVRAMMRFLDEDGEPGA